MQKFNVYICRFGAIAMALISLNANADPVLVDVRSVDPTITVDLRYAGRNNFLRHSLYPRGTHALARPEIVSALAVAQNFLRRYQYGLKIWDAYRPVEVQAMLWDASHNSDYVANPEIGAGSLHSWGIAVDATLVDSRIRDVRMPTDFDDFTPACNVALHGSVFRNTPKPAFAAVRHAHGWFLRLTHRMVAFHRSLIGKNTCRLKKQRVPSKP